MPDTSVDTGVESVVADLGQTAPPRQLCPFCGQLNDPGQRPCGRCGMEDTPGTRQATQSRVGPWSVLQQRNPLAPGMNFQTLLLLIRKGRITARTIVRGPTTGQFWRYAGRTKGLSREFGLCWSCGQNVQPSARVCRACQHLQEPPLNPDVLLERPERPRGPAAAAPASAPSPANPAATTLAANPAWLETLLIQRGRPGISTSGLDQPLDLRGLESISPGHGGGLRTWKAIALAVVLAVAAAALVVYLSPTLREQAMQWLRGR